LTELRDGPLALQKRKLAPKTLSNTSAPCPRERVAGVQGASGASTFAIRLMPPSAPWTR